MLIGSRALAYWDSTFKVKENSDWDIINPQQEDYENIDGRIDHHDYNFLNNSEVFKLFESGYSLKGVPVCSPIGLWAIKRSHLHRDQNFDKHIIQYHKHIIPLVYNKKHLLLLWNEWQEVMSFLNKRIELTKKELPQGNPNLKQTNKDFFDDAVDKKFDHDWLHELYAYEKNPMYTKLKYSGNESSAWCEKDLWEGLTKLQKLQCVAEECYVIATERFIVPNDYKYGYRVAYHKALGKVCTTLTSGWFRDFAIDNYPRISALCDKKRFDHVVKVLQNA